MQEIHRTTGLKDAKMWTLGVSIQFLKRKKCSLKVDKGSQGRVISK